MPKRDLPSIDYLRQRLRYEPETGKLFWRFHAGMPDGWNTRFAGEEALITKLASGYMQGSVDGRKVYAHRVVWAICKGAWPEDQIDHIDQNRSHNRLSNLREVGSLENCKNCGLSASNTSGVTGVSWNLASGKWIAYIKVEYEHKHLGTFADLADAVAAREAANIRYGFHPNHGK